MQVSMSTAHAPFRGEPCDRTSHGRELYQNSAQSFPVLAGVDFKMELDVAKKTLNRNCTCQFRNKRFMLVFDKTTFCVHYTSTWMALPDSYRFSPSRKTDT